MEIQLSEIILLYKKLIKFVLPSIVMMIFTSIYGVVDGLFVSNFARKTAFAAINLIMPILMGLSATWIYHRDRRQRDCSNNSWRRKKRKGK